MQSAIYLIASVGKIKIGYSKNPWKRYRQLCTGAASPMALIATVYCYDAPAAEKFLHNHFKEHRAKGEWFNVGVSEIISAIGDNNLSNMGKPGSSIKKIIEPTEEIDSFHPFDCKEDKDDAKELGMDYQEYYEYMTKDVVTDEEMTSFFDDLRGEISAD